MSNIYIKYVVVMLSSYTQGTQYGIFRFEDRHWKIKSHAKLPRKFNKLCRPKGQWQVIHIASAHATSVFEALRVLTIESYAGGLPSEHIALDIVCEFLKEGLVAGRLEEALTQLRHEKMNKKKNNPIPSRSQ